MRVANIVLNLMSLILVAAGLALIGSFFVGTPFTPASSAQEASSVSPTKFDVPVLKSGADKEPKAPKVKHANVKTKKLEKRYDIPKDKTLRMTIPKMSRVHNAIIPYTDGDDEQALRNHTAIHLKGTGFPSQKEANVYIAGHRLGYLNSQSLLAFYDLNKLKIGDKIYLADTNGKQYVYKVYKIFAVDPSDVYITQPIKGKNIVSLQTCTLPDFSERLVVRAEKVS